MTKQQNERTTIDNRMDRKMEIHGFRMKFSSYSNKKPNTKQSKAKQTIFSLILLSVFNYNMFFYFIFYIFHDY